MASDWIFKSQQLMYPLGAQVQGQGRDIMARGVANFSQNSLHAMSEMSEQHMKARAYNAQLERHRFFQEAQEKSQLLQQNKLSLDRQKYDLEKYTKEEEIRSKQYGRRVVDKKSNYYAYLGANNQMQAFDSEKEMQESWQGSFPGMYNTERKTDIQGRRAEDLDKYRTDVTEQKVKDRDLRMWKAIEQAKQFKEKHVQKKLLDAARMDFIRAGGALGRFTSALGGFLKESKGIEDLEGKFLGNEKELRAMRDQRVEGLIGKPGTRQRSDWDDLKSVRAVEKGGKMKRVPAVSAADRKRLKAQIAEIDAELQKELDRIKSSKSGARSKFAPIR